MVLSSTLTGSLGELKTHYSVKNTTFFAQETPMTTMTHYSRHAQARQQQRGIPGFVIESLIRFGWGDLLQLEGSSDHRWGVGETL
jgi:hypothetical protein